MNDELGLATLIDEDNSFEYEKPIDSEVANRLKDLILSELELEFRNCHLSGNLLNTIVVYKTPDGWKIHIQGLVYDTQKWFKDKAIVYINGDSYASELDKRGSHFWLWYQTKGGKWKKKFVNPENHIGYVERSILDAMLKLGGEQGWQWKAEIK